MAARKTPLLDTTTPAGKHVQKRLQKEIVIWLATVGAGGKAHAVPVWFLWDGKTFLIYSLPGQKVNDVARNPNVALHLNSTADGSDVVRFEGEAKQILRQPPAYKVPAYIRKYAALVKSYGWTPASFSADYKIALRVRPTRFHTG
jgi:PPOX class probable F420-dependent enzyme